MSQYNKKLSLFLLLFLLPLLALEILLRQPEVDSYALKHHLIESTLPTNEVLILGTSLAWTGLNPALIDENCINVANFNQAYYYDYQILNTYLPKSKNLKTVILPLSTIPFFIDADERMEQLYSIYWGIEPYSGEKGIENYAAVTAFGLWTAVNMVLHPIEKPQDRGWGAFDIVYDGDEVVARNWLKGLEAKMDLKNFPKRAAYLERIADLCEANNVRLILFYPPYSPTLNKILEGNKFEEKMKASVSELLRKRQLEFYDFNDNEVFPAPLFRDANHLNKQGAEKLSPIIREIIAHPRADRNGNGFTGSKQ